MDRDMGYGLAIHHDYVADVADEHICRACGQPTDMVLDMGRQPRSNGFVVPSVYDGAMAYVPGYERTYRLEARRCPNCGLWQLGETLPADVLFGSDYPFMTGTSRVMREHMAEYARYIACRIVGRAQDQTIVEVGCNDGTLMEALRSELPMMKLLGVDPAKNVADVCRRKGFTVWERLFDSTCAREIEGFCGKAAAVVGANVVCHVDRPLALFKAVSSCLRPTGVFVFEEPYLLDVLERYEFEQFYDEHPTVLSVGAVNRLASLSGMRLLDCQHTDTHGGSMRYVLGLSEARWGVSFTDNVARAMRRELELNTVHSAAVWASNCTDNMLGLQDVLLQLFNARRSVDAYGATSKSTVLYNWMRDGGFNPGKYIRRIYDNSPGKIGKFSPGVHIPVVDSSMAEKDQPDYMLLTAWNHADEIKSKCAWFSGKWITYVPKVEIG